jgi:transcriptional regulator with XRE-family HTH domain
LSQYIITQFGLELTNIVVSCPLGNATIFIPAYLAEISGIGRVHISELENGRREAGLRILEMLAVSFGISLSKLLSDL